MAWQSGSAMAGGGMGGGGETSANGSHAPLGTEYTLQGARNSITHLYTSLILLQV
jgi:hypothetical protein